ncbi:pentapeptide repeat-containing protein [Nocardioides pantholopis]|uniref:pentapeptide repeat-containing protein n=1 Tax=Nocardioides pantholopis TaxID=2483798 RepID=UPI0019D1DE6C|nr:pentapeptide repeat-containing protein [Nocardioides pantholopis]
MPDRAVPSRRELPQLSADCARCFGLCCVALPFGRSAAFAFDKAAGEECRHLTVADTCGIHASLRDDGMAGCTVFDCLGAGQQVAQVTYRGVSWRDAPGTATQMYAVLDVMRQLHEMLALLTQAAVVGAGAAPDGVRERLLDLVAGSPEEVLAADVGSLRGEVGDVLRGASARHRAGRDGAALAGADLVGADLRGRDLRYADLRGALALAARLDGCDLTGADLLGADLRDARLDGADLSGALFLLAPQVAAARGSATTRLPVGMVPPAHWR